ncbi:uncharacterized protein SOCEGT47_063540 [Sorangium cellulosum]|jgi:hypothetical protein|uniref:Uncharacterized protein n=1 Tax=Sorangium cellulosum TaxID=56 RepID=A0A4V0NED6_SORCE|nr:hypothetical protein [Sorangium cellulosum]AUX25802.1 uncharacterized protein SOCEGT47_063540 [Sorangium cellulosum]
MLDPGLPAVVLPDGFPAVVCGVVLGVDVAPGELAVLTAFRVTGSQPEAALGFGVGLGAAAWFKAPGAAVLPVGLLVPDDGCAKLPALFT